jgi:hypothetical protein
MEKFGRSSAKSLMMPERLDFSNLSRRKAQEDDKKTGTRIIDRVSAFFYHS